MVAVGVDNEDLGNSFFERRLRRDLSELQNFSQEIQRKLLVDLGNSSSHFEWRIIGGKSHCQSVQLEYLRQRVKYMDTSA